MSSCSFMNYYYDFGMSQKEKFQFFFYYFAIVDGFLWKSYEKRTKWVFHIQKDFHKIVLILKRFYINTGLYYRRLDMHFVTFFPLINFNLLCYAFQNDFHKYETVSGRLDSTLCPPTQQYFFFYHYWD